LPARIKRVILLGKEKYAAVCRATAATGPRFSNIHPLQLLEREFE